jgi:type II secretory pathway pseudopilin PulG
MNGGRGSPAPAVGPGGFGVRGFTFVELLIAATMMSILFLGLGAHLRGGLTVWQQATTRGDVLQHRRVALDRLERDLANAVVYDTRADAYGTGAGQLPPVEFSEDAAAWFTVERAAGAKVPAVRAVTYRCETIDGVAGLWRTSQSIGEARAQHKAAPQLLLPGCTRLTLRYGQAVTEGAGSIVWSDASPVEPPALPGLVELMVGLDSGDRFTQVCAVPTGSIQPAIPPSP